ncbi:MBL fold metallo-hydrolase [Actinokineospora bangkokensis]|uniref:Zn-dependent hydrolase n=1 Tax=Actinokineospora bangkokensis TaxID=1193682 RepID=A0A1Q9LU41_9PSEU|nr:MBL fold metallo-hydrolase [Actinokineospora bangkokensis]OLR95555.1 Zn-dependent hydrolase [Actinokineospora bangkokensis]
MTRVDRVVTSGTFSLDGGTWDVENNVWIVGDDEQCVVVDAAHDLEAIKRGIGDRRVLAIVCTHAHDDHINQAAALASHTAAPVKLHPADDQLWQRVYPGTTYQPLAEGDRVEVAGTALTVLHTPGHAPGAVCLHAPELGVVFSGDTLFQGGPGATGRSFSDFPTIIGSITDKLLVLPEETVVHTGHGDSTTIGAEAPHRQEWIDRGH